MHNTTLVQEGVRRLLNCNTRVTEEERREVLQSYVLKMRRSGYNGKYRKKIIEAALGIHREKVERDERGERPLYRSRAYQSEERRLKKETQKKNWYNRDKTSDKFYMAPLIMNPTPGGELGKKIRVICEEVGEESGIRVKPVERGGEKLRRLCKSNPLGSKECGREKCLICKSGKTGRCYENSAGYRCICLGCKAVGKKAVYEGETGGSGFLRQQIHSKAVEKGNLGNALAKHMELEHEGRKEEFEMEVTGSFGTCVERQADEGTRVRIAEEEEETLIMNSKSEFHQPPLVRLVPMGGNSQEEQISQAERGRRGRGARGQRSGGRGRGRTDRQTGS
jgi:hypothetical protein